jgi:hypothetical protein
LLIAVVERWSELGSWTQSNSQIDPSEATQDPLPPSSYNAALPESYGNSFDPFLDPALVDSEPWNSESCRDDTTVQAKSNGPDIDYWSDDSVGTAARNRRCQPCGRVFTYPKDLRRHNREVHRLEQPYICEICSRQFSRESNMIRHRQKIHGHRQRAAGSVRVDFLAQNKPGSQLLSTGVKSEPTKSELNDVSESGTNLPASYSNLPGDHHYSLGETYATINRNPVDLPRNDAQPQTSVQGTESSNLKFLGFACSDWRNKGSPAESACNKDWGKEHRWFQHCRRTHKIFRHGACLKLFDTKEDLDIHVQTHGRKQQCKKCRRCFDSELIKRHHVCESRRRILESGAEMWQHCYNEDYGDGAEHDSCEYSDKSNHVPY